MKLLDTRLPDIKIIEVTYFDDSRGFLTENYNKQLFESNGIKYDFVQDFHSKSLKAGTLRGLHFQNEPKSQTKLIRVTRGAIYDVVVDIRVGSPTYRQWVGLILSETNRRQLLVPKGFAHGFYTIVDNTEVMYKVDDVFSVEHYFGILWNDPDLCIEWPQTNNLIISDKDLNLPRLNEIKNTFHFKGIGK